MITAKDAIQSLYKSVRGTYMQRTFSTTSRQFVPDLLLQRPSRQFVPDALLLAEVVGFEPTDPVKDH